MLLPFPLSSASFLSASCTTQIRERLLTLGAYREILFGAKRQIIPNHRASMRNFVAALLQVRRPLCQSTARTETGNGSSLRCLMQCLNIMATARGNSLGPALPADSPTNSSVTGFELAA